MEEIWKKIGFGNNYEVSNIGRVRVASVYSPYIMKTKHCKSNGYEMINLSFENKPKTFTIHSLVARAFIRDYDGNE